MLTIKCAKCHKKLFKYLKIGKGKVLKCFFSRIEKPSYITDDEFIKCSCGNVIGKIADNHIKMIPHTFIYSGTKESK